MNRRGLMGKVKWLPAAPLLPGLASAAQKLASLPMAPRYAQSTVAWEDVPTKIVVTLTEDDGAPALQLATKAGSDVLRTVTQPITQNGEGVLAWLNDYCYVTATNAQELVQKAQAVAATWTTWVSKVGPR